MRFDMQIKLQNKLRNELSLYYNKLLSKDKIKILESSYETCMKERLSDQLINMNQVYYDSQIEQLLDKKNLIDELYNDWLYGNSGFSNEIAYSIEDTLNKLGITEEKDDEFIK